MLLRTKSRQVALGFKIVCVISLSLIYLFTTLSQTGKIKLLGAKSEDRHNLYNGRHLLAVDLINESSSDAISTTFANISSTLQNPYTQSSLTYNRNLLSELIDGQNCTPPAINNFPSDGLTKVQRQHGWVVLYVAAACYLFIFLAIVCDHYFVPCIKELCDILHLDEDVAGATLIATAGSSPDLFMNTIGTFITQGDLGIGAVVGSAVFNTLGVPACCGLFANVVLDLEWYPLTRDSLAYGCSVILLIVFLQDKEIYYYEALTLVLVFACYVLVMIYNDKIRSCFHKIATKINKKDYYNEIFMENTPLLSQFNGKLNSNSGTYNLTDLEDNFKQLNDIEESTDIWEWPSEDSTKAKLWWMLIWPITFVLHMTVPNTRNRPKVCAVTFTMCVFWIGIISYLVAWFITVIGDTLNIPDSVMGITFLAVGTSVPEAVFSLLLTNQGHGSMGISSCISTNTYNVLLCLGIPWFIKSAFYPTVPGQHSITIHSKGIHYSTQCVLATLVLFYISMCFNKFRLDWKIGLTCLIIYVAFLVFSSLMELNVFFQVNPPKCSR